MFSSPLPPALVLCIFYLACDLDIFKYLSTWRSGKITAMLGDCSPVPEHKPTLFIHRTHMWMLNGVATQHYWRATKAYHEPPCRAPTLFLISNSDPVGNANRSRRAHASMTALGIKVLAQIFILRLLRSP